MSNIIYHDMVWQNVDRARMNGAVWAALRRGGRYVVCDSSARTGAGVEATTSLHHIDEMVVRNEVAAAGFTLAEESNFLRDPADPRDWNSSPAHRARWRPGPPGPTWSSTARIEAFTTSRSPFTGGFVRERTGNDNGAAYEPLDCQGFLIPSDGACDKMPEYFSRSFNDKVGRGEDLSMSPVAQGSSK